MKDRPSNLLCANYYKLLDLAGPTPGPPLPGQIVSAHTVYPPTDPWILKVVNYNAFDESKSEYVAKRYEKDDRSHMPIAELRLRSDENYYLYIGKERPLIVVRSLGSRWLSPLHDESLYACVPIFSFKPRHNDEFRIKTMGFCHPDLFYMPTDANGCTDESAARFELIQPIARKALHNYFKGSPSRPVALSDDAFALFVNHLGRFLLSKDLDPQVCEQMDIYRSLVLEELQRHSTP
jgi:hypothetical protein